MDADSTQASDTSGILPYDINGYTWEMKDGDDIEEGDLLPGYDGNVYEVCGEAGYNLSITGTYYITIMVNDGAYDWLPSFTTMRKDNNEAMRERVDTHLLKDEGAYWTLVPEDE